MNGLPWLEKMAQRMADLPESYRNGEDLGPIEEGEEVIGVVPESLRPLLGLVRLTVDQVRRSVLEHHAKRLQEAARNPRAKPQSCSDFRHQASLMANEAETLKNLFFTELCQALNDGRSLAVRQGFQVVVLPEMSLAQLFHEVLDAFEDE